MLPVVECKYIYSSIIDLLSTNLRYLLEYFHFIQLYTSTSPHLENFLPIAPLFFFREDSDY